MNQNSVTCNYTYLHIHVPLIVVTKRLLLMIREQTKLSSKEKTMVPGYKFKSDQYSWPAGNIKIGYWY